MSLHTTKTALCTHICVHIYLLACGHLQKAHLNISQRLNIQLTLAQSRATLKGATARVQHWCKRSPEWRQLDQESSWSMHGNLRMIYKLSQLRIITNFVADYSHDGTHGGWSHFRQGPCHAQTMFQRFIACSWCEALSTGSSHKPCCYTWFVCHDISQHNVLLAQARPTMVKHLCLQQWCALNRIIFFYL